MSEIHIRIPDQQPALEIAITRFIAEEFDQQTIFSKEQSANGPHKDASLLDAAWQGLVIIATLESTVQFSERVLRMKRVKKLLAAIKGSGKSVYIKINNKKPVDLSQKSIDETMDLFVDREDKE